MSFVSTHPAPAPTVTACPTTPGGGSAASPLPGVVSAGYTVPTVGRGFVEYANFDHAASTPAFTRVATAVERATRNYSSVHRGQGWASRVTSAQYEAARAEVATFVGARADDVVVFTRNTTDSFNLLARAVPTDAHVVVFSSEHHATLLPWPSRRTHRLPVPGSVRDAEVLLDDALVAIATEARESSSRRRAAPPVLVVLTGASNVTGEFWPVKSLTAIARRRGARVALDAAQLAPHRAIDLADLDVDWLAFSGHKVHAPYGAGVLVGRSDWLDAASPYLAGGGATAEVTDRHTRWASGPARHEAGSPNVLGAIALAAACATIREQRAAIERHEAWLGATLVAGLRAIEGVQTYSIFGEDADRAPVVTFTVDGLDSHLAAAALSAEHGIGVRAGKFCAHILVDTLLEEAGEDGLDAAIRVSGGIATTAEHVDRLVAAVADLAAHGPRAEYTVVSGQGWVPVEDTRDLSDALPW